MREKESSVRHRNFGTGVLEESLEKNEIVQSFLAADLLQFLDLHFCKAAGPMPVQTFVRWRHPFERVKCKNFASRSKSLRQSGHQKSRAARVTAVFDNVAFDISV